MHIDVWVPYIINIVYLLHVSANLLAILMEVHYRGYFTDVFETMHKCKALSLNNICLKIIDCGILVTLVEHFFSVLSSFAKTVIIISWLWSIYLLLILGKNSSAFVCKRRKNFRFPVLYYISYILGLCSLVKYAVFLCIISRSGPCNVRLIHIPSVSVAVRCFKVLNMHVKPHIAWV